MRRENIPLSMPLDTPPPRRCEICGRAVFDVIDEIACSDPCRKERKRRAKVTNKQTRQETKRRKQAQQKQAREREGQLSMFPQREETKCE